MKKIFAFLLAFTFCFLCFGTYGFEDAALCTEDHDHSSHVYAADDITMTVVVNSSYDESDEELELDIEIELSESVKLNESFEVEFRIDESEFKNSGDISVSGNLFGKTASVSSSSGWISFGVPSGGVSSFRREDVVIRYDNIDPSDFSTKRSKLVYLDVRVSGTVDSNEYVDLVSSSYEIYICEHRGTTYSKDLVAATCEKGGTKAEMCSACDAILDTKSTFPLDHQYDYSKPYKNVYAYKAPTCLTSGYGQFKCLICETLEFVSYIPPQHTYGNSYVNEDGDYEQKCSECGNIKVSTCKHNFKYSSTKTVATCEVKGVEIYKCSKCDVVEERDTGYANHTYGAWKTTKDATCDAKGEESRACTVCFKTEKRDIAMIDHDFGEWKLIDEATCIADGLERRTCKECGEREERKTEKSGHRYGGWKVDTAPTCIATGLNKRTCSLCGDTETEVTDKVAHTYGAWAVTKAATCVATGIETRVCAVCQGEDTRTLAIDVNGHAYGDWKVVTPKTCVTNGVSNRTCALCQHVDERVDEATGHVFGPVDVDGKLTTKTCSCGYTETIKTGKKGNTKTLADYSGSLEMTGAVADKNVVFEISAMTMDTEAEYKKYLNFSKGYTYKVLVDGEPTNITSDMAMTLKLDGSFEDYEVSLAILKNGSFLTLSEYDRNGLEITIDGAQLIGTENIFVMQGKEMQPNIILPIVITVAILAIAGIAVFVIMSKNKSKNTFN